MDKREDEIRKTLNNEPGLRGNARQLNLAISYVPDVRYLLEKVERLEAEKSEAYRAGIRHGAELSKDKPFTGIFEEPADEP